MEQTLEQLSKSSIKFLEQEDPQKIYKTIVEEARNFVSAKYGSILLDKEGELVRVYASSAKFYPIQIRANGFTRKAFISGKAFVRTPSESASVHNEIKKLGIKSTIFIPLSHKKNTIGVLTVDSIREQAFTKRELEILKIFGTLASLAITKAKMHQETKNALETRDFFIALASHELRTPMTSISGYIQLLYGKLAEKTTTEGKWVRELFEESKRLTNIVTELLEINRIKQGQFQFILRECVFQVVVKRALEQVKKRTPHREFVFRDSIKNGKDLLIGDPDKLVQMLDALLSNAVKFSPEHTPIVVELELEEKNAILRISDQGEGIEKHALPHIFDEFYKVPHEYQKEGMGIGLLLAKHIVTYHKGKIQVMSEKNKGTTIEVCLPLAEL